MQIVRTVPTRQRKPYRRSSWNILDYQVGYIWSVGRVKLFQNHTPSPLSLLPLGTLWSHADLSPRKWPWLYDDGNTCSCRQNPPSNLTARLQPHTIGGSQPSTLTQNRLRTNSPYHLSIMMRDRSYHTASMIYDTYYIQVDPSGHILK